MGRVEVGIELVLVVLLVVTMLYAIRLHRAISTLRQDRTGLAEAVAGFDSGTRQAEAGLDRLRETAQQMASKLGQATELRDDLVFLSERGEQLADRLDALVRAGRTLEPAPAPPFPSPSSPSAPFPAQPATNQGAATGPAATPEPPVRSRAERDLLQALRMPR